MTHKTSFSLFCLLILMGNKSLAGPVFTKIQTEFPAANFFDIGVVDYDNDGNLDIFSSNHTWESAVKTGDGQGNFSQNDMESLGLNPISEFPGIEVIGRVESNQKGIKFYRNDQGVDIIKFHSLAGIETVSGVITFDSQLSPGQDVVVNENASYTVTSTPLTANIDRTTIDFSMSNRGVIKYKRYLQPPQQSYQIDAMFPATKIRLGAYGLSPESGIFTTSKVDRHGMAWADYDGDGSIDTFMSIGGLKGFMPEFPTGFDFQLYRQSTGSFSAVEADQSGLLHNHGRGRTAYWVDYNGDGRLDLHSGSLGMPDQLFEQQEDGTFIDKGITAGLGITNAGPRLWLDIDGDGDPDLITVDLDDAASYLYENDDGNGFTRTFLTSETNNKLLGNFTIADIDNDGDIDIFRANETANYLLLNTDGVLSLRSPGEFGLPQASVYANFVDFDNDGRMDIFSTPGGIFAQDDSGMFSANAMLVNRIPETSHKRRSVWFDADHDGYLDVLMQYQPKKSDKKFNTLLYKNAGMEKFANNWSQIRLHGGTMNPQAIGARVRLVTPEGEQTQVVGQFEHSENSQGHYRLYFGLGDSESIERIVVTWPDGSRSRFFEQSINNILDLHK